MNPATPQLYKPELAHAAKTAPSVAPLRIPGWQCEPYEIQSRGITWLYATPQAYLGDVTGTGKTIHGVGLCATLLTNGEARGRKLIISCLSSNIMQWVEEFDRFLPGARVVTNKGLDRMARRRLYTDQWDVLVTGYRLLWADKELIDAQQPWLVWFDESSTFRNRNTETASGARVVAARAARVVCADATSTQAGGLFDIYPQLEVMGLAGYSGTLFGNEWEFKRRYIVEHETSITVRGGKIVNKTVLDGYNNLADFAARFEPHYLRRSEGSGDMPDVMPPEDIYLDLTKPQIDAYRAVAKGQWPVGNKLMAYQQITAGTATFDRQLGDHSAKFDWLLEALRTRLVTDDGAPAKVVIFSRFLATSQALSRRLSAAGIGNAFIDGPHAAERDEVRHRFWDDPALRVVIGTQAMERGMNLQIAKYVITIDLLFNPGRLEQILGRIKRSGSPHKHIFMLRLLAANTFEPKVLTILRGRQELADRIQGDVSDLFPLLSEEDQQSLLSAA